MSSSSSNGNGNGNGSSSALPMSLGEYARYGRQMILPNFGLPGQIRLRQSKVLVVGAGGLGCPAVQYLAAAGVGQITIVDHDVVEQSNLSRQILHNDQRIGMNKAKSAAIAACQINPFITAIPIEEAFTAENACHLVEQSDIILDCTDNVMTRYLISDAAVLSSRQVVSGAAQGMDGQLVTLFKDLDAGSYASGSTSREQQNVNRGPCYRCLFPKAPRPEDVTDCEDGGVLGVITGLVGTLQATEAINLLIGLENEEEMQPMMTLCSPMSLPPFRSVKLRKRRTTTCRACGEVTDAISKDLQGEDYMTFCGLSAVKMNGEGLRSVDNVEPREVGRLADPPFILDVRPLVEYGIVNLPNTVNVAFRDIDADPRAALQRLSKDHTGDVYVICRRGNDSKLACHALNSALAEAAERGDVTDLRFLNINGGFRAWAASVDKNLPVY